MVVLLARLHLSGFLWGDVSLSNTLFRATPGRSPRTWSTPRPVSCTTSSPTGSGSTTSTSPATNIFGEFCDLEAGGLLDGTRPARSVEPSTEPLPRAVGASSPTWRSSTRSEMHRIERRVRRLNDLGFDVAELDITTDFAGVTVRIQPKVVDAGHHSRRLLRLTGLDAEENQARRLLNDLDYYRARPTSRAPTRRSSPTTG